MTRHLHLLHTRVSTGGVTLGSAISARLTSAEGYEPALFLVSFRNDVSES